MKTAAEKLVDSAARGSRDCPALPSRIRSIWVKFEQLRPGLLLTGALSCTAMALHHAPALVELSPLLIALVLGVAFRRGIGLPPGIEAGVQFSLKWLLRTAIALLGLQLTTTQISIIGGHGFAIVATTAAATFLFAMWLGGVLKVERKLTVLLAAGTTICGASAIVATNAVTQANEDDMGYAIACITLFGTASMLLYPGIASMLHMTDHAYGLWVGASMYDVGQAVATAFQYGSDAGQIGTIAKLSRVLMLAPLIVLLGIVEQSRANPASASSSASKRALHKIPAPVPAFVVVFILLIGVNSAFAIPQVVHTVAAPLSSFLFAAALAATGLNMQFGDLRRKGLRPLALAATLWLFISIISATLVAFLA